MGQNDQVHNSPPDINQDSASNFGTFQHFGAQSQNSIA